MTGMRVFQKLTWVELKLFVREPLNLVFALAFPVLTLIVLGAAFGNAPDPEGRSFRGIGPMDYYVPAYIGLAIAAIGLIGLPVHMASYRERGVLRRFRASGMPPWTLVAAQAVVAVVLALAGSTLLIATGLTAYDVHAPKSPAELALAFVLSALSFAALGVLLGVVVRTARAAQGLGLILFFVMMFLSGTAPSREVFGTVLLRIGDGLLLTHVVTVLQNPWSGLAIDIPALVVVAGTFVVAAALAVRFLRWD